MAAAPDQTSYLDFTVATAFERLAADIESCLTTWRDGKELQRALGRHAREEEQTGGGEPALVRLTAQLRHRLPFRSEPYTLALHLPPLPPDQQPEQEAANGHTQQQQHGEQVEQHGAAPGKHRGAAVSRRSSWDRRPPVAAAQALHDATHRLQQWLGLHAFLLLTPDSYSGRVLDEEEAHTLLSAAAVALSHARITWPLLVPVHDAVRDAYQGVAVGPGGCTLRLDSDSLHASRLPGGLLQPREQLLLLARQLAGAGAPAAAAAARAAAGADLDATSSLAAAAAAASARGSPGRGAAGGLEVALAVRHCHALPSPGEDGSGSGGDDGSGGGGGEWDEQAPWRPWAAQSDPVGCLELDVAWRFPSAAAALQALAPGGGLAQAGGWAPAEAASWRLLALSDSYERDSGRRGFVLRPVDKPRRFLRLQPLDGTRARRILRGAAGVAPAALPGDASFFGMLLRLADSCKWAARAPALGLLASASWWPAQGAYLPPAPPDWVLREAIRDVFQQPVLPMWPTSGGAAVHWPSATDGQHGCLGKAAPLGALISRFTLHALALGTPRAVAELWSRFVAELRLRYWEPLQPLPRMRLGQPPRQQQQQQQQSVAAAASLASDGDGSGESSGGSSGGQPQAPDLSLSLVHQKLQLLDLCIHLQLQRQQAGEEEPPLGAASELEAGALEAAGALEWNSSWADEDGTGSPTSSSSSYHSASASSSASSPASEAAPEAGPGDAAQAAAAAEAAAAAGPPADEEPQGVAGTLPGAFLHLHPDRPLHVPAVQDPPAHTEDVAVEQAVALAAAPAGGGGAADGVLRAQLQGRLLLSDMQAFKAANPGCCLLDFLRWHSPKDCVQAEGGGWQLSGRMAAEGNAWQRLWAAAAPLPAAQQRPLLDPRLEGERALHFLETLPPAALWSELLAVGYSAAVQLLGTAGPAAELAPVRRQLDCLVAAAGPELQQGVAAALEDSAPPATPPQRQQQQPQQGSPAASSGGGSEEEGSSEDAGRSLTPRPAPQRQPSWLRSVFGGGLSSGAFRRLLLLLGCAEQTAVAAHSLLLHLEQPGSSASASGRLSSSPSEFAVAAASGLVTAALGEQQAPSADAEQQPAAAPAAAVDLAPAHWPEAEALLVQQQQQWEEEDSEGSELASSSGGVAWPEPFLREWLWQVLPAGMHAAAPSSEAGRLQPAGPDSPQRGGGAARPAAHAAAPVQRMYVKALAAEVRLATALSCERG